MDSFKKLVMFYFNLDLDLLDKESLRDFFLQSEVWDIRQCDVCGHTIVVPYNSVLAYHISKAHLVPGNYKSILEDGKPITLVDAFEKFKLNGMEKLNEGDFLSVKNLLTKQEILDLKVHNE